jgi:hypothetical protein
MPAETPGVESTIRPGFDHRRRSERRACDLDVVVRTGSGELPARLLDVSAGGLGLHIATLMALKPGARLLVIHPRFGEVPCVLRWAMHPRYGAECLAGSHAQGRVHAFYDALPRGPGEI